MKFLARLPLASAPKPDLAALRRSLRLYHPAILFLLGLPLALISSPSLQSQEPQPAQTVAAPQPQEAPPQTPAATPAPSSSPAPPTPTPAPAIAPASALPTEPTHAGEVTEDELKQLLVGKQLFLRGGYLGDSISFTEHGGPAGHPAIGSYTLCGVEIEKVHLTKHKVELEGSRYALHFLGAMPYEDSSAAVDRVRITPKKKVLRITIDREQVVKPKKQKEPRERGKKSPTAVTSQPQTAAAPEAEPAEQTPEQASDQAADRASVTTTLSPAHAARVLREALDRIFAPALDDKVRAQMPEFWQLYYQAQAAGVDYRPHDPSVQRSSAVDQQAKVLSSIAPDSNEYAQAGGIAGRALYRAVIGIDGKPGEIAVVRPIGFGLDENAVAAIRKATFQPALKGGQPVAETLDLAVLFRIYSQRTSVAASDGNKSAEPVKPGPYSVRAQQEKAP